MLHPFFIFYFLFLLLVISIIPRSSLSIFTNDNLPYPRSRPSRFFFPTCPHGPRRPFPARACTHSCLDHAAPHALNVICAHCILGAIIPALVNRIPSELYSEACLGESSTKLGDHLGSPRVTPLFYFLFLISYSFCSLFQFLPILLFLSL